MCRCKVLFERSSLDLMGKRRVGKGSGGLKLGWRDGSVVEIVMSTFPPSSYDERRVREREKGKKRGGGRYPDESEGRGGMEEACFSFVHCSLV